MNNNDIEVLEQALDKLKSTGEILFPQAIKSIFNHEVITMQKNNPEHKKIISRLEEVAENATTNAYEDGIMRPRPNEVGNDMEPYVKRALKKIGFKAETPRKRSGGRKSTGYPDIYFEDDTGKPYYLEIKTFNQNNINTKQRAFYLSLPKKGEEKINHDAPHILMSFQIETENRPETPNNKTCYIPVAWKLVSLDSMKLKIKNEFNASNHEMYQENSILSEG